MKMIKNDSLKLIVKPLLTWYGQNARILPWRQDPEAYRVWVSEIMLQQTRVEAVKPYYQRFLSALPDIRALAEAKEQILLKLWEGLGYYNRVRNMQKAAIIVMEQYNGMLPDDYNALLSLPGIGSYTAGAVASIAYRIPVPAVDGNVLRVISRVLANEEDILKQSVKRKYEAWLLEVMPAGYPGEFNQSLMELGATICIPNGEARCEKCPLETLCEARKRNIVMRLPKKAPKKQRRVEEKTVLIIQDGEKIAIRKRKKQGLLAGLYEFPNMEGLLTEEKAVEWAEKNGFLALRIQKLPPAKHIFSHVEWRMTGYVLYVSELEKTVKKDVLFVDIKKTETEYPIPSAFVAYTDYMNIELGVKGEKENEYSAGKSDKKQ